MASTAFIIPQTGSGSGWTNPSNLTTDSDSTYAQKSFSISETSAELIGTNYNFSGITAGSTIDGIEVEVRLDTSFAGFTENQIQLTKGGTLQGSNKSTGASISTSWSTMTYGGATDKWGWTAVTLADIQTSTFGLACKWTAPSVNAKVMYVNTYRIKVYYTEPSGEQLWATATINLAMTNSANATVSGGGTSTDTGWLDPTSATTTGSGDKNWEQVTNIYSSNNSDANVDFLSKDQLSNVLLASGFNFSAIGSGDTIDGIEVRIEKAASSTGCILDNVLQLYDGTTAKGNNKADTVTTWSDADSYVTYGGSTDTWGWTGITKADLDSTFGVGFKVENDVNNTRSAYVDHIQVKVYYTSESGGGEFNGFLKLGAF